MDKITDLEKAKTKAEEAGIPTDEVWLNDEDYLDLQSVIEKRDGKEYIGELRVRKSKEEEVRVGSSSCMYGPGVT
jgi:hypothetical protein